LQREKSPILYRVSEYIVLDEQVTDNRGDEDLGSASPEREEEILVLDSIEI
jgi:hypothetical protein